MFNNQNYNQPPIAADGELQPMCTYTYNVQQPPTEQYNAYVNAVNGGMHYLGNAIFQSNQMIVEYVNAVANQLEKEREKKKKKIVLSGCLSFSDKGASYVQNYDDGTRDIYPFFQQTILGMHVYQLDFKHFTDFKIYMIALKTPDSTISILCEEAKCTPSGLYNLFVHKGIQFVDMLVKSKKQSALFEYLAPRFENAGKLEVIEFQGWNKGSFFDREDSIWSDMKVLESLPIMKKQFWNTEADKCDLEAYFSVLNNIRDIKVRTALMLYPFAGLLASIFAEVNCSICVVLNCVSCGGWDKFQLVTGLLTIFNRFNMHACEAASNYKVLRETLCLAKDEVVVFDGVVHAFDTYYKADKISNNLQLIIDAGLSWDRNLGGQKLNSFAVALYSNNVLKGSNITNLFIMDETFGNYQQCLLYASSGSYTAVLNEFVRFAESNLEEIFNCIQSCFEECDKQEAFWMSMFGIMNRFFKEKGYDIFNCVGLPADLDVKALLCENDLNNYTWTEVFIKIFRKEVRHLVAGSRNKFGDIGSVDFYFDQQYIWVLPDVVEKMLKNQGLNGYTNEIMSELKREEILVPDGPGFRCRLQSGNGMEMYRLCRSSFDSFGGARIVDLAKEVKE